ncbi:uncharacterized protein LOC134201645 [Bombyx mori]|uniref:uncharacterized protein LOC134201645 n=1 Tax=Bombyx mori TaxID=7091 RepID=UPI002ED43059
MTFGAWNVRTLLDRDGNAYPERKTAIVARELHRYHVDVAALSETHLADEGELVEVGAGYIFFWKGTAASETRHSGVGFAIKNHLVKRLEEYPVHISDRITTLRVHLDKDNYLNVISVYAPTLDKSDDIKDKFYGEVTLCLDSINAREQVLLLGDFNARVGRDYEAWPGVLGRHGVGNINSNGQLLLSLCAQYGLAITNTMFRLAAKYKTTWMHPRSKHWHLIDYAIVRQRDFSQVQITRVMRGAHCWSDHRLIVTKLRLRFRRPRRSPMKKLASLDIDKLRDPEVRKNYAEVLSKKLLPVNETGDVDADWGALSSHIMDTASIALGRKCRRNEDWFDGNDEVLRAALDKHRDLLRQHRRRKGSVAAVKASDFELRKLSRQIKDKWLQDKAIHMQWLTDTNQLGEFYSEVRKLMGELIKYGGEDLHTLVWELFVRMWEEERVPDSFKVSRITALYKNRGDRSDCDSYRGISLLSAPGKVFARVLLNRLKDLSEKILPETQFDFRSDRGTCEAIFSVRQLQEKSREQGRQLYLCFVDLEKAFDSVPREALWLVLRKLGCTENFVALLRLLHDDMQCCVTVDGEQ